MDRFVQPVNKFSGEISMPGDKSIWHRALIISAIANGETEITGNPAGLDVESTKQCLLDLGVSISSSDGKTIVNGNGFNGMRKPENALDVGNSGSTIRLMSGVLSAQKFETLIDGDSSIRKRPMNRIVTPLSQMGAHISSAPSGGCPLRIKGNPDLNSITYDMPVASAQVKSAILLAGVTAGVSVTLSEPHSSRDHTEIMLRRCGAIVEKDSNKIRLEPCPELTATNFNIPGDFSSAAYFIAAAILIEGSDLLIKDVGLNPTRIGFLNVVKEMGAAVEIHNSREESGEIRGDISVKHSKLNAVSITAETVPSIIDELPLISVLGAKAEGITTVSGAGELRVKESDRISLLIKGLRSIGIEAEEFEDGFSVRGNQSIIGGETDTGGDHRMVMTFAIAALASKNGITVRDAESSSVSYPSFFNELDELGSN
ncbi:MAG: 3-phosphoshikimate 1-carboxyvinyltransferase [Candidatus Marinimicrobia bacterium]|nr:3-phosphoshikimate 1-carboxyvinyltransferase [Candidatus Neomarinimicrobiota bacterium]